MNGIYYTGSPLKGYSEPYYGMDRSTVNWRWIEKYKQGLLPKDIHSLIKSIANDGSSEISKEISNIFSKLQKEEKKSLEK